MDPSGYTGNGGGDWESGSGSDGSASPPLSRFARGHLPLDCGFFSGGAGSLALLVGFDPGEPLPLALLGRSFALVGEPLALVGQILAVIGDPVALICP